MDGISRPRTDGVMEWLFAPSQIRDCEWHDSDFNWFDLELVLY